MFKTDDTNLIYEQLEKIKPILEQEKIKAKVIENQNQIEKNIILQKSI